MNKYQDALSNYFTAKLQFDNEMYKSMELLEELVEKATPKKPLVVSVEFSTYEEPDCWIDVYKCPSCEKDVYYDRCCQNNDCRQAIDWGKDDER